MKIANTSALVTGASRGIGRALVDALLAEGAARVYAAARDPAAVSSQDPRVVKLRLDVTDAAAVAALATAAPDVTLLINNAGTAEFGGPLDVSEESIARNFAVNVYGLLRVSRALAPVIERNGGGAIANVLSVVSLAAMPAASGYNASKAAAWSLTQSLRGVLAGRGIAVHGIFPGPIDTDMAAELTLPKTSAPDAAAAIVAGIAAGEEDIFPDPMSRQMYEGWRQDHKAVERQFAAI